MLNVPRTNLKTFSLWIYIKELSLWYVSVIEHEYE